MKSKRFIALFVGLIGAMALGGAVALAQSSDDTWGSGQANQAWSASSSSAKFTAATPLGTLTITCTNNTASGSSTGSAPDVGHLAMNAPTFRSCSDNFGGTDTVTTVSSGWEIAFWSDLQPSVCPGGGGTDESTGSDCVGVFVPQNAATIVVGGLGGCTITVQPSGSTYVAGPVTDPGTAADTFSFSAAPLAYSGCSTSGTAYWTATYTLSAPNSGKLVDGS